MDDEDDYYYRNADPRVEHRGYVQGQRSPHRGGGPRYPHSTHGTVQPMTHGTSYPMTHNTGIVPPMPYGVPPYGYPPYGYPPAPSAFNMKTIGTVIRAATPFVVAMLSLPQAPTPIPPSGDMPTDAKNALTNQANAITYQTSLAQTVKRDELVFAVGEGIGLAMEKFSS